MCLPVNIASLVHGDIIEWERMVFKQRWDPQSVMHGICAFANDIHGWGGGYLIIGMSKKNALAGLPPKGMREGQLNAIQKEVARLGHALRPHYSPVSEKYVLSGRLILVLWCPAGDRRPYSAPATLDKNAQQQPYVRIGFKSMTPRGATLKRLMELAARIPFDDRINHQATIQDFDLGLIRAYLQETGSGLYEASLQMPLSDICRAMHIAKGPDEDLRPLNAGLLFFSKQPEHFFPYSWIEVLWHRDQSGKNFSEYYFKGPLHWQLRNALSFLSANVIREQVVKQAGKIKADRSFNFPSAAIEETLANSAYHKSYELASPIEVQVWPDRMEILSFPGPVSSVNATILKTQRCVRAGDYRNRRIGDFLKALRLTGGHGTGFPAIYHAMAKNGSPDPVFETEEDSQYFLSILPAHTFVTDANNNGAGNGHHILPINDLEDIMTFCKRDHNGTGNAVSKELSMHVTGILHIDVHQKVVEFLTMLRTATMSRKGLMEQLDLTNQTNNRVRYLDPLLKFGWVEKVFPGEKINPHQLYRITKAGRRLLYLLNLDQ